MGEYIGCLQALKRNYI